MCGIVGSIGFHKTSELLIEGLKKLEYRGYDSCGISLLNDKLHTYKNIGRVNELVIPNIDAFSGIAHTRWATHGCVNKINSHPHFNDRFSLVHNGVIENYKELKQKYFKDDKFISDTDTEVILKLITKFYKLNILETLKQVVTLIKGSYACIILDKSDKDNLYIIKKDSPLLIGSNEEYNIISSDTLALSDYCNKFIDIPDLSIGKVSNKEIFLYDYNLQTRNFKYETLNHENESSKLDGYKHFMLKEIDEQPIVLKNILKNYFIGDKINIDSELIKSIKESNKLYIIAAGTSYHAGLIGKMYFEKISSKKCEVIVASEFIYENYLIEDNSLFIFISQSGETQDLLKSLNKIKNKNKYKTLAIVNQKNSTLYRNCDYNLLMYAKKEIAVASTKAYTASLIILYILSNSIVENEVKNKLKKLSIEMEISLLKKNEYKIKINKVLDENMKCFFIGRNIDYLLAKEASLKLKEISYIHSEAYPSGELKHGTISLIDESTLVIAINTKKSTNFILRSNLEETVTRGASKFIISTKKLSNINDDIIINDIEEFLQPFLTIIPLQLISYYTALKLNLDIDKPRNLAKSVTVE